jgi:hypothetical protein
MYLIRFPTYSTFKTERNYYGRFWFAHINFDTTLWEFRWDYLSGDHPSGRVIKYAHSRIFNEYVVNYSCPLFPDIWTEVKFYVSYSRAFSGEYLHGNYQSFQ